MRPIFTIPIAGLITGVVGVLFGIPALRLAGVSLALATFAVAVSLPQLAKWHRLEDLTGGGGGVVLNLPTTPFGWDISVRHWLYYEAWVTAGILVPRGLGARPGTNRTGVASDPGRRDRRDGIRREPCDVQDDGVRCFVRLRGRGRALLAIEVSYVNPDTFPLSLSILLLASVVVGGLGALSGVIFGALLLEFLPIYAQDRRSSPSSSRSSPRRSFSG